MKYDIQLFKLSLKVFIIWKYQITKAFVCWKEQKSISVPSTSRDTDTVDLNLSYSAIFIYLCAYITPINLNLFFRYDWTVSNVIIFVCQVS